MKIAIVKWERDHCWECGGTVASSITEWREVSEEEYKKLQSFVKRKNKNNPEYATYSIVHLEEASTSDLLQEYLDMEEQEKEKQKEIKLKSAQRKKEKAAKDEQKKREMLEKLKKELGE